MDPTRKNVRARIASRMAELRAQHGRTQTECAKALGVAQNTYSEMETGTGRVRRRDLVTLAWLYGIDPAEAFPEMDDEEEAA